MPRLTEKELDEIMYTNLKGVLKALKDFFLAPQSDEIEKVTLNDIQYHVEEIRKVMKEDE